MKKLYFVLFVIVSVVSAEAQTLQFKQVKLIGSSPETVPANHVWKVESALSGKMSSLNGFSAVINSDTVYFGGYQAGSNYWASIASIKFQVRRVLECTSGLTATYLNFKYSGYEGNMPFTRTMPVQTIATTIPDTFTDLYTITPVNPGGFELSSFSLYNSGTGFKAFETKMIITYSDGSTEEAVYPNQTGCSNYSGTVYLVGSSTADFQVPARSKEKYFNNSSLPFWLPAGTSIKTGVNMKKISVIEFEVIP